MRSAIVTATDSEYLPAACCTLISCVGAGEAGSEAELFLLACDISAADAEKAHKFLKGSGALVEIVRIGADCFRPFRIDGYVSASTYSRLLLSKYFDDRWERLVYLDADTRVMTRLRPLIQADLSGKPIGAIHDYLRYLIYGMSDSRTRLALRSDAPYFNAGVICFDWRATLSSGLLEKARAFASENAHLCKSHDQDALNKSFEGAWAPLDPRWNFMTVSIPDDVFRLHYPENYQPYISHFAGPVKPWTPDFPIRFDHHRAWYRDLLCDSPWPHFVAPSGASPTSARSRARRLKRQCQSQLRRLRMSLGHLFSGDRVAAQEPAIGAALAAHPPKTWSGGDANPALADLFDRMIEEAAGFGTQGVP